MHILMIAPEPFFQPRGTPFSEYYRARAFIELGHQVDMVTYPIGSEVRLPGLRIFRAPRVPGIRSVKIGPSWGKIPLDAVLLLSVVRRLLTRRYDLLDCHEEAGLMGAALSRLFDVPTIYDMHSSLPEQLTNFRFTRSRLLMRLFDRIERWAIKGSHGVIVICPHLREAVRRVDPDRPCFLIENSPLAESGRPVGEEEARKLRRSLGLDGKVVILYTGTFEAYQGLDLLFEAARRVAEEEPRARLLLVGGHPDQVKEARESAHRQGLRGNVSFTGQRPPSEISLYLAAADILVSPRSRGTNTPLKIYSYLRAGKPIVATRLPTHTQVLDDEVAELTLPEPEAFAKGILRLVRDSRRARRLADNARRRAEEAYSYERYLERTRQVLDFLSRPVEAKMVPTGAPGK
ncbi:MAG: glycosyltransferase family 4 protein [Acidobacteriota bacterium]